MLIFEREPELESLVSMLLSRVTSGSNPIITTGVTGNVNTESGFDTVIAISTSDFSNQILSPVVDGKYAIFLEPSEYLIQVIGSNSYETITVTN